MQATRAAQDLSAHGWTPPWHENGGGRQPWNANYGKDSPFRNATWEDWEQWYSRREKEVRDSQAQGKRDTIIDDSTFFIMAFLLFVGFGSMVQLSRLESQRVMLAEERDRQHRQINRELILLRRDMDELGTRDQRVQNFLRVRDPGGSGITKEEVREERMQRLLQAGDMSLSDTAPED